LNLYHEKDTGEGNISHSMKAELLIIFAKHTGLGTIKSRLARSVGDRNALAIYLELSRRIRQACTQLNCDIEIHYDPEVEYHDPWKEEKFAKFSQTGADIGQRMKNAFASGLGKGYKKACLIGTDIYGLSHDTLEAAFDALSGKDLVIGPALDGGYYLIGMKTPHPALFDDITWSTDQVLAESLERSRALNIDYALLEQLRDIDTLEDLVQTDLVGYVKRDPR
jgi:rSAM/selenodomain-associated transferase 1